MKASKRKTADPNAPRPRTLARMAAVQALYQMDLAGTDVAEVIDEFVSVRFRDAADGADDDEASADGLEQADAVFFSDILKGVVRRQRDVDPLIDQQLATGWRLVRVDSILRAILRAAVFELMERPDVPARVIINEYINVAHAFFSEDEPRVVNGVLDRIAHKLRTTELKPET
jgi:N utilization substance protein B